VRKRTSIAYPTSTAKDCKPAVSRRVLFNYNVRAAFPRLARLSQ